MELREIIAKNICELRTERGLTQLGLAEILNYSDKAISKWERAESIPDVFVLKQIADYFGVSVDYLLAEEHKRDDKSLDTETSPKTKQIHFMISFLSASLVWLIATFVFVILNIADAAEGFPAWLTFIYAIPTSAIVLLVFNSIWGRIRLNYLIISILLWSLLLSVYLSLLVLSGNNIWLIFLLGIPGELCILLWFGMKFRGFSRRSFEKAEKKEDE